MKARDDFVQRLRREIRQQPLEPAERHTGIREGFRCIGRLQAYGFFHEQQHPPAVPLLIKAIAFAVLRRDQRQAFPRGVASLFSYLFPQISGYTFDVLHQRRNVGENTAVHLLQDISAVRSVDTLTAHQIGIVDMSVAVGVN